LSYNRADVEFVERLARTIEEQEYKRRKLRCFFAPWDIKPGENFLLKIEDALSTSRWVGLVMSPDWLNPIGPQWNVWFQYMMIQQASKEE